MTATVNDSFMDKPDFGGVRGASSFFWTMIALAVLDVVLLFWIMNPLARPSSHVAAPRAAKASMQVAQGGELAKPSPFGAVVRSRVR